MALDGVNQGDDSDTEELAEAMQQLFGRNEGAAEENDAEPMSISDEDQPHADADVSEEEVQWEAEAKYGEEKFGLAKDAIAADMEKFVARLSEKRTPELGAAIQSHFDQVLGVDLTMNGVLKGKSPQVQWDAVHALEAISPLVISAKESQFAAEQAKAAHESAWWGKEGLAAVQKEKEETAEAQQKLVIAAIEQYGPEVQEALKTFIAQDTANLTSEYAMRHRDRMQLNKAFDEMHAAQVALVEPVAQAKEAQQAVVVAQQALDAARVALAECPKDAGEEKQLALQATVEAKTKAMAAPTEEFAEKSKVAEARQQEFASKSKAYAALDLAFRQKYLNPHLRRDGVIPGYNDGVAFSDPRKLSAQAGAKALTAMHSAVLKSEEDKTFVDPELLAAARQRQIQSDELRVLNEQRAAQVPLNSAISEMFKENSSGPGARKTYTPDERDAFEYSQVKDDFKLMRMQFKQMLKIKDPAEECGTKLSSESHLHQFERSSAPVLNLYQQTALKAGHQHPLLAAQRASKDGDPKRQEMFSGIADFHQAELDKLAAERLAAQQAKDVEQDADPKEKQKVKL